MSNVHLLDVRWREVTNAFIESMEILPYANRGGVAEGSAQLTGLEAALVIGLVRQSPQEVDRVKIIDVHIHVVNPQLPGVKTLPLFFDGPPKLVADALLEQMQDAGADVLLGMGQLSSSKSDPLGIDFTLRVADFVPGLYAIGVADPRGPTWTIYRVSRDSCSRAG